MFPLLPNINLECWLLFCKQKLHHLTTVQNLLQQDCRIKTESNLLPTRKQITACISHPTATEMLYLPYSKTVTYFIKTCLKFIFVDVCSFGLECLNFNPLLKVYDIERIRDAYRLSRPYLIFGCGEGKGSTSGVRMSVKP